MNITDVGHMTDESSPEAVDKMLLAVEDEGLAAARDRREVHARRSSRTRDAVGIRRARRHPKATEHIPEMIELTETLVEKDHAYVVDSGSVYFDVTSFPGYGKLSGNTLDNLREGHRDLETDPRKRHAADFALWKAAGPGRLMKWPSPWGEGFPGWHIECSAMSMKYLGDRFDIHAGGNDLRFPHHEDEIAQSEGAVGHQVVSIWVHGGHLRLSGQKIAKSTGQRGPRRRARRARPRPAGVPVAHVPDALPQRDGLHVGGHGGRRPPRHAAPPADGGLGAGGRPSSATPRRASTRGSARRSRPTWTCPSAVVIVNELVSSTDVPDGEKYALLAAWDHVLGLDLEREATSALGAHRRDARADGRARRGPSGEGLRHGGRSSATGWTRWASR